MARVRRPQRDRKSRIWRTTTITRTDIVIGPWLRNMLKIQPTSGMSTRPAGGLNWVNSPALVGELLEISSLR